MAITSRTPPTRRRSGSRTLGARARAAGVHRPPAVPRAGRRFRGRAISRTARRRQRDEQARALSWSGLRRDALGTRLGRRGLAGYRTDVGNTARPLPLVQAYCRVASAIASIASASWQLCDLAEADDLARGFRDRAAAGALDLILDPGREHGLGPCADSLVENGLRDVEPDDQRRVAGLLAPEAVARRSERPSSLVQLEGADDSAAIVSVDRLRRLRISLGEGRVRLLGAEAVVHALPALARPGGGAGGRSSSASAARR